jgi:large repetitive protein
MKQSTHLKDYRFLLTLFFCILFYSTQLEAQPVVTGLSPVSGSIVGGQVVTITGSGFTGATSINFGDLVLAPTDFTVNNDTSITANIPASNPPITAPTSIPIVVDVTITTGLSTSGTSQNDRYAFTQGDWYAYIPDFGSSNVFTSNVTTKLVNPAFIPVGAGPNDVAITFDGKTAYVINSFSSWISVIDVKTMTVVNTFPTNSNFPILVSIAYNTSLGTYVGYTADYGSNTVTEVNLTTGTVLNTVNVGANPTGGILDLAIDPTAFYVVNSGSSSITRISLPISNTTPPVTIDTGSGSVPSFIVLSPDGTTAYFTDDNPSESSFRQLLNINTTNPILGLTITDPSFNFNGGTFFPQIAISALQAGSPNIYAYITNTGSNTVSPVDITDNLNPIVLPPIQVELAPNGTAITPDGSTLYVCNGNSNAITIVSGLPIANNTIDLIVGTTPTDPSITPDQAPLAYFTAAPTTAGLGQTVNFDGSQSASPVGTIVSYEWDFGDGDTATGQTVSHAYSTTGTFTVTLTVTNSAGTSVSTSSEYNGQVRLRNGGPTALYTVPITVLTNAGVPTTTTIATSLNPADLQQTVIFTATVTSGSGTPTGELQFTVDGVNYGSPVTLAGGIATINDAFSIAGSYSIGAIYIPTMSSIFSPSIAIPIMQVINPDPTMTTLIISPPNPSLFGQTLTFTANVAANNQPISGTPSGTVQFIYIAADRPFFVIFATGTLDSTGTVATVTVNTDSLPVDIYQIYAQYIAGMDDPNHTDSNSVPQPYVVNPDLTTTMLVTLGSPSFYGDSVTFTATIAAPTAPAGAGIPTGTVSFTDGMTFLGISILSNGVATFQTPLMSPLSVGLHSIMATYNPDTNNFSPSSGSVNQQVIQNSTTTVITSSSNNPSLFGQSVFFTAHVTPGSGMGTLPMGTVNFTANGVFFGSGTLDSNDNVISPSISTLPVGNVIIVATYVGDSNYTGSISPDFTQIVQPDPTTTTLVSSINPSMINQPVAFTATVANNILGGAIPTGTVAFTIDEGAPINVLLVNGIATLNTTFTTSGISHVVASYLGATDFLPSLASINHLVTGTTTTALTASPPSPSVFGQPVTFIALVTSNDATIPTGTIQFIVDGQPYGFPIILNGNGVANLTTSTLPIGIHTVVAVYLGDSTHLTSISPLINYTVNKDPTTTTLTSSLNPAPLGQPVSFTAITVANLPGSGIPTGTMTFSVDGGPGLVVSLVNGQAILPNLRLSLGNHTIVAVYLGDANYLPSTATTLIEVITKEIVFPPIDLHVHQVKERFTTQTDFINIITWKAPTTGVMPTAYKIYRNPQLKHLVATLKDCRSSVFPPSCFEGSYLRYEHHNRKQKHSYRYFIVSIDQLGNSSAPAKIVFDKRKNSGD